MWRFVSIGESSISCNWRDDSIQLARSNIFFHQSLWGQWYNRPLTSLLGENYNWISINGHVRLNVRSESWLASITIYYGIEKWELDRLQMFMLGFGSAKLLLLFHCCSCYLASQIYTHTHTYTLHAFLVVIAINQICQ